MCFDDPTCRIRVGIKTPVALHARAAERDSVPAWRHVNEASRHRRSRAEGGIIDTCLWHQDRQLPFEGCHLVVAEKRPRAEAGAVDHNRLREHGQVTSGIEAADHDLGRRTSAPGGAA